MGHAQPLAGNALVCGFDELGETVGTSLDVAFVRHVVRWADDLPVEPACGFRAWSDFGTS